MVDRAAGSVLSRSYKCGGTDVTGWVSVSQPAAEEDSDGGKH